MVLVVTFATTSRAAWRVLRVELLLAGVLIAGIAASQLVTSIPASGQMGPLAVIATAGILLVAWPIARLVKLVRSDLVS
ncbi:MAG: hypothetical protein M3R55_03775 [Acidobacteriota bacterium]|nr:hypothetical protein [Acidobacteriota bacterium]